MERFFHRPDTHWRRLSGALHFYVNPPLDGELIATHHRVGATLERFPGLAVQPGEYVHMTLQRLDAYEDELDPEAWAAFERRLGERLAQRGAFTVEYAPATPNGHAVEAMGAPTPAWRELVDDIRDELAAAGFGEVLTPAPYGPHYTHAYCVADTDDDDVRLALREAGEDRTGMLVDEVALVAVDQHPDDGTFTFDTLTRWPLGLPVDTK